MRRLVIVAVELLVTSAGPPDAYGQESLPAVLRRVAPSVVRVRVADDWATGFVYPTPKHVTTSYSAVNHRGELSISLGSGTEHKARVVAWSAPDDLAILEVDTPAAAPVLTLTSDAPAVGSDVVVLGYPRRRKDDEEQRLPPRKAPTPRFARVSLASSTRLGIDANSFWTGDVGAPVVLPSGEVAGVLRDPGQTERGVLEVTTSTQLAELGRQLGAQGTFEPSPAAETSFFMGFYASPLQSDRLQGAGLLTGYRYNWLAATLSINTSQSGFAPMSNGVFGARTELAAEIFGSADLRYARERKFVLGVGAAVIDRFERARQSSASGEVVSSHHEESPARLLLVLQSVEQYMLIGVTIELPEPTARLDVGLVLGR